MELSYTLIRSDRKTLALRLLPDGSLEVRAPRRWPKAEIDRFVLDHAGWVEKHRQKRAAVPTSGAAQRLTEAEIAALKQRGKTVFAQRTAYFAPLVGVRYGQISVRCQKTKWGSCSSKGNLNFNCLLLLAPPEVLDYVVVHELCHRLEMNHSARFWAQVERVLPDYRQRRKWLRDHGSELMARAGG